MVVAAAAGSSTSTVVVRAAMLSAHVSSATISSVAALSKLTRGNSAAARALVTDAISVAAELSNSAAAVAGASDVAFDSASSNSPAAVS